jgi:hypothetical protein
MFSLTRGDALRFASRLPLAFIFRAFGAFIFAPLALCFYFLGKALSGLISDLRQAIYKNKKARRFLPSAAPTIPTGGKGYSTPEIIEDLRLGGNVRYRPH